MRLMGIVFVLFLALTLVLALNGCTKTAEPPVEQTPVEEEPVTEEEPIIPVSSVKPQEEYKCATALGVAPCSCSKLESGDIMLSVKNSGRGNLKGIWFYVEAEDGSMGYYSHEEEFAEGEIKEFTLELTDWETGLGSPINDVYMLPAKMINDTLGACANQKLLLIKTTNCRDNCGI